MNKILKIFAILFLGIAWMTSCAPDEITLEDLKKGEAAITPADLVAGIAFTITHDDTNPNIVYLKSLMGAKYTPLWNHPQGRSQEQNVTLKIAFDGDYYVQFGVITPNGIVYGDTATFHIDEMRPEFVDHELWKYLTGGIGNTKTWIYDDGSYGFAAGELTYADPSTVVEFDDFSPNWDPGKSHTGDDNIWNSTMTFSLQGGAFVTVHNTSSSGDVDEEGSFILDVDNKTLSFSDARLMHTQGWDNKTADWSKGLKVLTLTENQLRVAVLRDKATSGDDPWWLIWNYVSKDFADSYVPEVGEDPVPDIGGNPNDILSPNPANTKTWILSYDSPYDWAKLDGTLINNLSGGKEGYTSTGWAGYDSTMIAATKFKFTSMLNNGGFFVFSFYPDGQNASEASGAYTIDGNNDIYFGQPLSAKISESDFGWTSTMKLETATGDKLRIVKTKKNLLGLVTDVWLGKRDPNPNTREYFVYHFVDSAAAASPISPDMLSSIWKGALAGKTFKPDVNWFVDWVTLPASKLTSGWLPTDFTGGWTSESTFGSDYTSNGWVWDANVAKIAKNATLRFYMDGSNTMKVDVSQTKSGTPYSATGTVTIDVNKNILNIDTPLIDYDGTAGSWVGIDNSNFTSFGGAANDWFFVSHGGSNLSNISTNGFWLGRLTGTTPGDDGNIEVLIFHYILATP
jgi:hypothetical protein